MSRRRYVNGLSKDFGLFDIEGLNEKKGLVLVLTQQKGDFFFFFFLNPACYPIHVL